MLPALALPPAGCLLSVVAPCFNEQDGLADFHARVTAACRKATGADYEIIFVNDGSTDGTLAALHGLWRQDGHCVIVDLARNHGHQAALTAGLAQARGAMILVLDADLQDPPELLEAMIALLDKGADVVYGQRRSREGEPWAKRVTAHWFYRLLGWLADTPIPLDTGDFRLMRRHVLETLCAMPEYHRFIRGMVAWIGFHQVPLLYDRAPRQAGQTHYSIGGMLRFAGDAITGFSVRPLRLAMVAAGLGLALAGLLALYTFYSYFISGVVQGWTSLVIVFLLFSALQLFCLGVMGEYIGRIYIQSKARPLFIVREVLAARGAAESAKPVRAAGS